MTEKTRAPLHLEHGPRRVRAVLGGRTVADSVQVLLAWDQPYFPRYFFPVEDVAPEVVEAYGHFEPTVEALRGHVRLEWQDMDRWYEEGDEVFVHPRDPYHRVEVLDTDRDIRVEIDGEVVAESHRARFVFETLMPVRYYIPPDDVIPGLLTKSATVTSCPYKGTTRYWNVHLGGSVHEDVVWSYPLPVTAAAKISGLVCFDAAKVDVFVNGERQDLDREGVVGAGLRIDPSSVPGHVEITPKRVRAVFAEQVVADSGRARWVWENLNFPEYYFPQEDIADGALVPSASISTHALLGDAIHYDVVLGGVTSPNAAWQYPDSPVEQVRNLVRFDWQAMDRWYEESEEVFVDPRNPYARLDALESGRRVQVKVGGLVVADTVRAKFLFETRVVPRYYIPHDDVRFDLLTPSARSSRCPFKGVAQYWNVEIDGVEYPNIVWSYPTPLPEVSRIAGHLCFYNERAEIAVDGEPESDER